MPHTSRGRALYAMGYTKTIAKDWNDIRLVVRGVFSPEIHDLGRYGIQLNKGSLAGERAINSFVVDDVCNHPSNPLDLRQPYTPQPFDGSDAAYVCLPGDSLCAFDRYFIPKHKELFPEYWAEQERPKDPPPSQEPPPVTPPPPPQPNFDQRLLALEARTEGLLRWRVEKDEFDLSTESGLLQLGRRIEVLERGTRPTPPPLPPLRPGLAIFRAPDFTVGSPDQPSRREGVRFTDNNMVMRCSFDPAKDRYKSITLEMDVEIPQHHFTGRKGQKENLFWLARTNNRDLIGYALLTEDDLVAVEGMGMVHGEKERVTGRRLGAGKYHLTYVWNHAGPWILRMNPFDGTAAGSGVIGSATGALDFSGGRRLLLDIGFPGAPDSPEIATPGWKFTNITITLEE